MDPRAYRVAQAFVAAQVRKARYSQEFLQWSGTRKFRNPETGNDVKFVSLPVPEQVRIYQQWKAKNQPDEGGRARTPDAQRQAVEQALDIARNGSIVARESLSAGGAGEGNPGVNVSEIVRLRHNGQDQIYIRKPADGEESFLRVGIPSGTYHSREQAAFGIDQLLGQGGVVPPTVTRGDDDGSYQLWSAGSSTMVGDDLNDLVQQVSVEDLQSVPSFHRLNLLDLIQGHEDRHRGNLMHTFDGQEATPENLRFIGIDNGLAFSNANPDPSHHAYINPWRGYYYEDKKNMSWAEQVRAHHEGEIAGDKAVATSLTSIPEDLQQQLQAIDLGDAAKQMVGAGVKEQSAVRAALSRIAALQADPKIFQQFLDDNDGNLEEAWQGFQYEAGTGALLDRLDDGDSIKAKVDEAIEQNKPDSWRPEAELVNYFEEAMAQEIPEAGDDPTPLAGQDPFGDWADLVEDLEGGRDSDTKTKRDGPADIKTRKDGPKPLPKTRRDGPKALPKTQRLAQGVRDRWLRTALRRTESGS